VKGANYHVQEKGRLLPYVGIGFEQRTLIRTATTLVVTAITNLLQPDRPDDPIPLDVPDNSRFHYLQVNGLVACVQE
jgi:hypothetical protein